MRSVPKEVRVVRRSGGATAPPANTPASVSAAATPARRHGKRASAFARVCCAGMFLVLLLGGCRHAERAGLVYDGPPVPPNPPTDWKEVVRANRFKNSSRLGLWKPGCELDSDGDPGGCYTAVGSGDLGRGPNDDSFVDIYVIVHGWAPGYRPAVDENGDQALWWTVSLPRKNDRKTWASSWAWLAYRSVNKLHDEYVPISKTGLFQAIQAYASEAQVVGYSWIDDSATANMGWNLTRGSPVYQSEAYTNVNGLRLAQALEDVIDPRFWKNKKRRLHLIAHSHGSKVATVAALTLQQRGYAVDHLTLLDSPEDEISRLGNGANLLGFYFNQLDIAPPIQTVDRGDDAAGSAPDRSDSSLRPVQDGRTFVDSYASCFGMSFAAKDDASRIKRIVQVGLDPSELNDRWYWTNYGMDHSYAAAWYAGTVSAMAEGVAPNLGPAWPPQPEFYEPALNQTAPSNYAEQWALSPGRPLHGTATFSTETLHSTGWRQIHGYVSVEDQSLCLGTGCSASPDANGAWSCVTGGYDASYRSSQYGVAFDLDWRHPGDGDYLVLTVDSPWTRGQETILVLDGSTFEGESRSGLPISFESDVSKAEFRVYFYLAKGNPQGSVTLRNFLAILDE